MFFSSKPYLSNQEFEFIESTFIWLLRNFGGEHFNTTTRLILPTNEFFDFKSDSLHEMVSATFIRVKELMGVQEWPCTLNLVGGGNFDQHTIKPEEFNSEALSVGDLDIDEDGVTLTVNVDALVDPSQVVYVLSRELSLYIISTSGQDHPAGSEFYSLVTDIASVFFGFGVFTVGSAFLFQQSASYESFGWRTHRMGNLTERQTLYALAIFCHIKKYDIENTFPFLKSHLIGSLEKAVVCIQQRAKTIQDMEAMTYNPVVRMQ